MKNLSFSICITFTALLVCFSSVKPETGKKAMTFLDLIEMKRAGSPDISPDGTMFIYTISTPHWESRKSYSDIHITSIRTGEQKQMTYTKEESEHSPKWYKDGSFFAFLSDRSEEKTQIYFMHPDGGEARQITEDEDGVNSYQWSRDWKHIAYMAGKPEKRQLWLMSGKGENAVKLSDHKTPVTSFSWNPDSRKIYFIAPDRVDSLDEERKKKKFDVDIKDKKGIPSHLWEISIETKEEKRLTQGEEFSVTSWTVSDDGTKIAFIGKSTERYISFLDIDVYLLNLTSGKVSRITDNGVGEGNLSFSPDSRRLAFTMPDNEESFMNLEKIYLIPSGGGKPEKLLNNFSYEGSISFWSEDNKFIYFTSQVGVNYPLFRVEVETDEVERITDFGNAAFFSKDKEAEKFIVNYSDPDNPSNFYYSELENFPNKDKWIKLSESNPRVNTYTLGKQETIQWVSSDGKTIEGILIKPEDFQRGRRYPLIVQIHGGPAGAFTNRFSSSWSTYPHIFTAHDYVIFQPNYRGSTGYGEKFTKEIAGDYFRQAFDDIMSGVDFLIDKNIVHPDSMGFMGWSAGGHWSNWTLVSTDRFKAISTGAGAVNWISLYAQTDVQFTREFYFKGTPYDNWEHYIEVSPLKYIKNAKTPTLIHFGEDDRRIPRPQGEELYIALKKLGVPTEFIVYPNMPHGLSEMRYQMVKMQAEFNWFEKWIRGKKDWFDWKEMLETLKEEKK